MIIANPLYDTIFKHLMEDLTITKGFLSVLLNEKIVDINFYEREHSRYIPENVLLQERIRLFRLDFVAEIERDSGKHKVLIELQKSSEYDVPHRFRAYIGRTYSQDKEVYERLLKEERREAKLENRLPKPIEPPDILPIIPIIILGYKLEPPTPSTEDRLVCHIKRSAVNPNAGNAPLDVRYPLAEYLSHDLILIQLSYLPEKPRTGLELILSIFEQRFLCEDAWKKHYPHHLEPDHPVTPLLRDMLKKLNLITEDEEVAERLRGEEEGELHYTNLLAFVEARDEALREKDRALTESERVRKEQEQAYEQALSAKERALEQAVKLLTSQGMSEAEARATLGLSGDQANA